MAKPAADIPVDPLVERSAGIRPGVEGDTAGQRPVDPEDCPPPCSPEAALLTLLASPDQASKRWIWEQYDHLVMGRTRLRPGGNAAVVGLPDSTRALALTTDCTPRYCTADPVAGGRQAVAEAWRNLTAVGATPLAMTNNLNFGDPTRPEIMGQLAGCVTGMAEACRALDFPVVSGNVSLYNETGGQAILPTPVIGGVGVLEDGATAVDRGTVALGHALVLIGGTAGHLGASIYLRDLLGSTDGPPPHGRSGGRTGATAIWGARLGARPDRQTALILACHDLSDGGLALALAEMALAGRAGIVARRAARRPAAARLAVRRRPGALPRSKPPMCRRQFWRRQQAAGVPAAVIGETVAEPSLTLREGCPISLARLREAHEGWLPGWDRGFAIRHGRRPILTDERQPERRIPWRWTHARSKP